MRIFFSAHVNALIAFPGVGIAPGKLAQNDDASGSDKGSPIRPNSRSHNPVGSTTMVTPCRPFRLAPERLEDRDVPSAPAEVVLSPGTFAVGSGVGGGEVRVLDASTGAQILDLFPFGQGFTGGVHVATANFNGDNIPDIVAGMASGGSQVTVLDGKTGAVLQNFTAFDPAFTGGVNVAAGYVSGGQTPDIVVGVAGGGGPQVKVFDGSTGAVRASFYAYNPTFTGGVNVAAMDINGDGYADIVTGAGAGGGPEVKVFDGVTGAVIRDFFAYDPAFRGGVNVAAADVTGAGYADIITGAGASGGPEVKVFDGMTGVVTRDFYAYDPSFRGGVWVDSADVMGSGYADIVTGAGAGGGPQVNLYDGQSGTETQSLYALKPDFSGGVDVAAYPEIVSVTVPPSVLP